MGVSGRVARFFQTSQLTPLIALVALLLGLFAVAVTPREEEPQINVTMADVFVPFPGASARDVEALVATPGEQVLAEMRGVKHVFSVSRPGLAVLTVQFQVGVPRTEALVRLYNTIHSHRDWLSPDIGVLEPIVKPKPGRSSSNAWRMPPRSSSSACRARARCRPWAGRGARCACCSIPTA